MAANRGPGDTFARGARLAMLVAQGNVVTASLVRELLGVGPAQAIKDVHRLEAALANARLIRLPRINGKGRRYYVYGVALRDK